MTSRIAGAVATLFLAASLSLFVTFIVSVLIWPGEATLTAPLFCPDDRISAEVVRSFDTSSVPPFDYSLRCVDPDGQVTDAGALGPLAALWLAHTLLLVPLVVMSNRRGWSGHHHDDPSQVDPNPYPIDHNTFD